MLLKVLVLWSFQPVRIQEEWLSAVMKKVLGTEIRAVAVRRGWGTTNSKVRGIWERHLQCLLHDQRRGFLSQGVLKTQALPKHPQPLPQAPVSEGSQKNPEAREKYQDITLVAIYHSELICWRK